MKLSKKFPFLVLGLATAPLLLLFQNCTDNYKITTSGSGAPVLAAVGPNPIALTCHDLDRVLEPLKIIVVADNSSTGEGGDAAKQVRLAALRSFLLKYGSSPNFSFSLISTGDGAARALTAAGSDPVFVDGAAMGAAVDAYGQLSASGAASFKSGLGLASQAISHDVDFQNGQVASQNPPPAANYAVVLISSGVPAEFGDATATQLVEAAVHDLVALSAGHVTLGTVGLFAGVPDSVVALELVNIANIGGGVAANVNALDSSLDINLSQNVTLSGSLCSPVEPAAESCSVGATRESTGANFSQVAACGAEGHKQMTYHTIRSERCDADSKGVTRFVEVSRRNELVSEGDCQGQSCSLPDGALLVNLASKTLYSSQAPAASCSSVSLSRTCNNGVLAGSSDFKFMSCNSGCGDFGINGTSKIGVKISEVTVPVTCSFGETGVSSVYNQIADQVCRDGQIVSSNTRQGDVKTAGLCPTYSYIASGNFTTCSADCGGTQSRIFDCKDDKGAVAPAARCSGAAPVETRVCDGNPAAVERTDVVNSTESSGNTNNCPTNQIGVTVKERTVAVSKSYACIDHQVAQSGTQTAYGPWVTESYCKDYVAYRCSQDSLSNGEAAGRYQWMLSCQNKVPAIKEFLTEFANVKLSGYGIGEGPRYLYPTFMNTATNPAKAFIAPKVANGSCDVPATAYVAAVCLSSCATPDQEIMIAEAQQKLAMRYMPFVDALTKNVARVATLRSSSAVSDKNLTTTKVQQWVTELIDTEHVILEFRTKSGHLLKVTTNHPLLAEDGSMKLASDFKVGENLVQLGGGLDQVASITETKYVGKVYNLLVESAVPQRNIVVTNGFLNGTAYFQNDGAKDMNRSLLRNKLVEGVFAK